MLLYAHTCTRPTAKTFTAIFNTMLCVIVCSSIGITMWLHFHELHYVYLVWSVNKTVHCANTFIDLTKLCARVSVRDFETPNCCINIIFHFPLHTIFMWPFPWRPSAVDWPVSMHFGPESCDDRYGLTAPHRPSRAVRSNGLTLGRWWPSVFQSLG